MLNFKRKNKNFYKKAYVLKKLTLKNSIFYRIKLY